MAEARNQKMTQEMIQKMIHQMIQKMILQVIKNAQWPGQCGNGMSHLRFTDPAVRCLQLNTVTNTD